MPRAHWPRFRECRQQGHGHSRQGAPEFVQGLGQELATTRNRSVCSQASISRPIWDLRQLTEMASPARASTPRLPLVASTLGMTGGRRPGPNRSKRLAGSLGLSLFPTSSGPRRRLRSDPLSAASQIRFLISPSDPRNDAFASADARGRAEPLPVRLPASVRGRRRLLGRTTAVITGGCGSVVKPREGACRAPGWPRSGRSTPSPIEGSLARQNRSTGQPGVFSGRSGPEMARARAFS